MSCTEGKPPQPHSHSLTHDLQCEVILSQYLPYVLHVKLTFSATLANLLYFLTLIVSIHFRFGEFKVKLNPFYTGCGWTSVHHDDIGHVAHLVSALCFSPSCCGPSVSAAPGCPSRRGWVRSCRRHISIWVRAKRRRLRPQWSTWCREERRTDVEADRCLHPLLTSALNSWFTPTGEDQSQPSLGRIRQFGPINDEGKQKAVFHKWQKIK